MYIFCTALDSIPRTCPQNLCPGFKWEDLTWKIFLDTKYRGPNTINDLIFVTSS